MTLQNRVAPDGTIIAHPGRGSFMGNRGILHDDQKNLARARWRHKAWVTCVLSFKGRRRTLMQPSHYTELFFLDEAVAFAAGHRPCGECRRAAYNDFRTRLGITAPIKMFDTVLHAARAVPRAARLRQHRAEIKDLPEGVFILTDTGQPALVRKDHLRPYRDMGYEAPIRRATSGIVTLLTPPPLVEALRAGYRLSLAVDD
ncbi:MAG: hypothetical protein AB8B62_16760 [Roseobacter sp.]